ncbi:MAG: serine/threonine protein kinase [Myxococcales bacterium]|nr:serine/threonine protein kinase [Myxococcales bacterium]
MSREPEGSFPERVGSYELLLPLGTGGMATVYLARTRLADGLYKLVALKLLHPHLRSEAGAEALLEEARLAARIRHANVVPVLEVGEAAAGVFMVMDYVEGLTLAELNKEAARQQQPLPRGVVERIIADALAGLHAAHEARGDDGQLLHVVHRDFSPQNILVGIDGTTRLSDFGIAKAASRHGNTTSGVIKGKTGYMAPEQVRSEPLDRRADIWAAGVVVWERLAGRRLHDPRQEQVTTLLKIATEPPPRLQSIRPEISAMLDQVVATALALDRNKRWPSAIELRRALVETWRREQIELADSEEVAECVRRLAAQRLEQRRARADEVLAARAAKPASSDAVTLPEAAPSKKSRAWPWLLALGATAGAAGVVLARGSAEVEGDATASAGVVATPAAPSVRGSVSAPPQQADRQATTSSLTVRANLPMVRLQLGQRHVELDAATREAKVTLEDDETRKRLRVVAVASGGRMATRELEPGQSVLELEFAPAQPRSQPAQPGIGKNPYRK